MANHGNAYCYHDYASEMKIHVNCKAKFSCSSIVAMFKSSVT